MIVTYYHTDGRKERRPVGYGAGLCHTATAPYEKREISGQMKKTSTPEAALPAAVGEVEIEQQQEVGR